MPVSAFQRNIVERQWVRILTVDPRSRRIEALLKDGGIIQVAVYEVTAGFRWPLEGEQWVVERQNNDWFLRAPRQDPGASKTIEDIDPGDTILGTDTTKVHLLGTVEANRLLIDGQDIIGPEIYIGDEAPSPRTAEAIWIDTDESEIPNTNHASTHEIGGTDPITVARSMLSFERVWDLTNATSLNITGLDGDTDIMYELTFAGYLTNTSGADRTIGAYLNGNVSPPGGRQVVHRHWWDGSAAYHDVETSTYGYLLIGTTNWADSGHWLCRTTFSAFRGPIPGTTNAHRLMKSWGQFMRINTDANMSKLIISRADGGYEKANNITSLLIGFQESGAGQTFTGKVKLRVG